MLNQENTSTVMKRPAGDHRIRPLLAHVIMVVMLAVMILGQVQMESFAAEKKKATVQPPEITAESAVLYCVNNGEIVYEKNADKRQEPYSITKLMTCLLAVEMIDDLDQQVTISHEAAQMDGSSMHLWTDEVVTVRQLLYGTMIVSGNDSAYALAEIASGGDVKAFVDKMNERAKELGATNTHFMNPNGLIEDGHYTTASDFVRIANAAFANKTVRELGGTKEFSMAETNKSKARKMETHTDLLDDPNSGVISGKTGYTYLHGATIALDYEKDGLNMILVLLADDEDERPKDATALFNYGTQVIERHKAIKQGEAVDKAWVRHGKTTKVQAYASEDAYVYPSSDGNDKIKTETVFKKKIEAPLKKGDVIGKVKISTNGKVTDTVPLVVKENVETGWFPSYLYISNRATLVILAVLILLILLARLNRRRRKKKKNHRQAMAKARKRRERRAKKDTYVPKH